MPGDMVRISLTVGVAFEDAEKSKAGAMLRPSLFVAGYGAQP